MRPVCLLIPTIRSVSTEAISPCWAPRSSSAPTVSSGVSEYSMIRSSAMPRFIPGKPNMVVQNMPGAGSLRAINYVANAAAKDGTPRTGEVVVVCAERVCAPETLDLDSGAHWLGVGSGFGTHGEALRTRLGERLAAVLPERLPHAADVARLAVPRLLAGEVVSAEQALPVYLRDKVATPRAPR